MRGELEQKGHVDPAGRKHCGNWREAPQEGGHTSEHGVQAQSALPIARHATLVEEVAGAQLGGSEIPLVHYGAQQGKAAIILP